MSDVRICVIMWSYPYFTSESCIYELYVKRATVMQQLYVKLNTNFFFMNDDLKCEYHKISNDIVSSKHVDNRFSFHWKYEPCISTQNLLHIQGHGRKFGSSVVSPADFVILCNQETPASNTLSLNSPQLQWKTSAQIIYYLAFCLKTLEDLHYTQKIDWINDI